MKAGRPNTQDRHSLLVWAGPGFWVPGWGPLDAKRHIERGRGRALGRAGPQATPHRRSQLEVRRDPGPMDDTANTCSHLRGFARRCGGNTGLLQPGGKKVPIWLLAPDSQHRFRHSRARPPRWSRREAGTRPFAIAQRKQVPSRPRPEIRASGVILSLPDFPHQRKHRVVPERVEILFVLPPGIVDLLTEPDGVVERLLRGSREFSQESL